MRPQRHTDQGAACPVGVRTSHRPPNSVTIVAGHHVLAFAGVVVERLPGIRDFNR